MKKIVSLLIVLVVAISLFAACEKAPAEQEYTLSIGVVVSENLGSAKVTETVASIVTDAAGKIVLCKIDCIEFKASYDEDGALKTTAPTSKVALGENYGTMPAGTWADQGAALEQYVAGMTQAEVAAIALEGGKATDAELVAGCSIAITDLLKAIDNAFVSEHKVTFTSAATEFAAGLSAIGSIKDSSTDESKNAKFTSNFAAAILVEGKVVASIIDTAEVELKNIADNAAESASFKGSKRAQGDAYDSYSPMAGGRWYQQADAFAQSAVGKTAADIATLATEGVAGCTMPYSTYDFKAGLEAAVASAK